MTGAAWFAPSAHYIAVDPNGWVKVDPNAIGGGFQTLLGFDTTQALVAPGGDPNPGVPAGTAVPGAAQRAGKDLAIIFEATRVTTLPPGTTPDFTNGLDKIHINNWTEVNELNFVEFVTGCCTPIDDTALGAVHRGSRGDGRRRLVADHQQLQHIGTARHHAGRLRPGRDRHRTRRLRGPS